ncbi:MAG: M1 family aminopeptidase/hydrolase [Saprospiraceae bacterium]|nr:M1 family aminopeptidase/hydrolase [Saprospiraceae bacterium]
MKDDHSFSRPDEARTVHLSLDLTLDFEDQVVSGVARHTISTKNADTFIVDIRDLEIDKVTTGAGEEVAFSLTAPRPYLGRGLKIPIDRATRVVSIHYRTSRNAAALGWLDPIQTAENSMPFVFTQGQAVLTRSWIPLQDSPGIRFTYDARVQVPPGMLAVMSAENPQEKSADGLYSFTMDQPIPAYLIALAAGDLVFGEIGPRTGVYAEPSVLEVAVYEFADMQRMLEIAEGLYGPYLWDRYDVIVLPPSFPFGGMENPRLTFATPTILTGDRSLVALIAHELAHSWSGNLVTNATWNDFWLNEGFTVYFEHQFVVHAVLKH